MLHPVRIIFRIIGKSVLINNAFKNNSFPGLGTAKFHKFLPFTYTFEQIKKKICLRIFFCLNFT